MSVIDDFKVKSVHVAIVGASDVIVEEGYAIQSENELDWIYTASLTNPEWQGSLIWFTALDYPENKTILEKVVN